jgi:hypothetical protein
MVQGVVDVGWIRAVGCQFRQFADLSVGGSRAERRQEHQPSAVGAKHSDDLRHRGGNIRVHQGLAAEDQVDLCVVYRDRFRCPVGETEGAWSQYFGVPNRVGGAVEGVDAEDGEPEARAEFDGLAAAAAADVDDAGAGGQAHR